MKTLRRWVRQAETERSGVGASSGSYSSDERWIVFSLEDWNTGNASS